MKKKMIISFLGIMAFCIFFAQASLAIGRNIIEFAQLYMNRVDNYYDWNEDTILEFADTDIQSQVTHNDDGTVVLKCLAGNATVNLNNLEITRLDMIPFSTSSGSSYIEWCGKCIVAISALEYDTSASRSIAQNSDFAGAVPKSVDIWNSNINISDALQKAMNSGDQLLYKAENYLYYLHYEEKPVETVHIIATIEEMDASREDIIEKEDISNPDESTDISVFVFGSDGNQVRINSFIGSSQDIIIPKSIDGLPVTMIGAEAFKDCTTITSVVIPEGVKEIGESAFERCKRLRSVTIPSTIHDLPRDCFKLCSKLNEVNGLENVELFGEWCFEGAALSGDLVFTKDAYLKWGAFDHTRITGLQFLSGRIKVECAVFADTDLQYCYIDENSEVELLDYSSATIYGAFFDCEKMTDMIVPATVHHFPPHTFEGCRVVTVYTPAGSEAERYAMENLVSVNTKSYDEKKSEYR